MVSENSAELNAVIQSAMNKLKETNDLEAVRVELPTDILYWQSLLEFIENPATSARVFKCRFYRTISEVKPAESALKELGIDDSLVSTEGDLVTVIVLWIENLLLNPFGIFKILSERQFNFLTDFLISFVVECTKSTVIGHNVRKNEINLKWAVKKHILRCLALLAKSTLNTSDSPMHKTREVYTVNTDHTSYAVFGHPVSAVSFYCFLKHLSIVYGELLQTNPTSDLILNFEDDESLVVKRYKIKILSNISNERNVLDSLRVLLTMINHESSRLGWTLCKAIHRMSRSIDRKSLVCDLIESLGQRIFSNEQCWINVLTIISFIVLEMGNDVEEPLFDDFNFVNIALSYDNEFVQKSSSLRESALFFVWSVVRSTACIALEQYNLDSVISRVVFMSLFDREFICRRAAANVLQEILGRMAVNENSLSKYPLLLEPETLFTINGSSVKRRPECLKSFSQIKHKTPFEPFVFNSLYSFDKETREMSASAVAAYFDPFKVPIKYKTVSEVDGTHLLINECIHNSNSGTEHKCSNGRNDQETTLCLSNIIDNFGSFINSFSLTNLTYKIRNMDLAIESYLKIAKYFDLSVFFTNFIFLVNRNFSPVSMQGSSQVLFENPEFSRRLFALINKNSTSVLVNSNNRLFKAEVLRKYTENLEKRILIQHSIEAITLMKHFPLYDHPLISLIKDYLSDYSVDFNGDIGYFNRRASFLYFLEHYPKYD
ncbi:uncharacterized protein VICG_01127 [Vittaforma corneae ATCC 50505]|uniref:Tubulin-folding cofactor D ARM repeats domain-containing protein n=1 Tax=Vittaforma corneae (strain ATCC 50505) TaxID=993615 RepID=L2GMP8_VITCO|nr:uncharacterized protein VICG_01127 [Vittaforma corneae ATCC 50505]ELA41775.1 hypothetical protein VICG_01127 [Vittaforma corneae ATCC 50505]